MIRSWRWFVLVWSVNLLGSVPLWAEAARHSVEFLSQTYTIDRKYRSMEGPSGVQQITLSDAQPPELLWITAYRVIVVGPDGNSSAPQEFMCHNNLDFDVTLHKQLFGWTKSVSPRLFTLSQGQFDIEFPKGSGMPIRSDEPFTLTTQVLNHNITDRAYQVKHKVIVEYVRDQDLTEPLKPLFSVAPFGMKLLEGDSPYFGVAQADESKQGPGCLPGLHAPNGTTTGIFTDYLGRKFSGHWVVKPGREINRTLVTPLMHLPFDTTLHYVAVHLHPFAETLELRDLTTNKTIFKSRAKGFKKGIGLADVQTLSNTEGIPMFKDHEYELVSIYNNTSGVDQDAMATFFLYLLDKEFQQPALASVQP